MRGVRPDHTGKRFGRWTVLGPAPDSTSSAGSRWVARCDCGVERIVRSASLVNPKLSRSCGCLKKEVNRARLVTHGLTYHPLYSVWKAMMERCYSPTNISYRRYGVRGIRVHAAWHDVAIFIAEVGPRPSAKHQLDRVDNDGNYEPGNVRWATPVEQQQNRSDVTKLTALGRTQTAKAWSRETGIADCTILARIRNGWPVELAVTKPTVRMLRREANHAA